MEEKLLIEILAEREGRGHAELRRMAMIGVLKDNQGNIVTLEDLSYDGPRIAPMEVQIEEAVGQVEKEWDLYQAAVIKLKEITESGDNQENDWDRRAGCGSRVEQVLIRVKNIAVHDDHNWAEQCFDQAHELCQDLQYYREEIQSKCAAAAFSLINHCGQRKIICDS